MQIKFYFFLVLGIALSIECYRAPFQPTQFLGPKEPYTYTIMLSPQGDSKSPGRLTPDGTERGVTRLWAEQIKKALEVSNPHIRVVFSHNLGEQISQQEKANFANRLQIQLFISLLFFTDDTLSLSPYYYGTNNIQMIGQPKSLTFCKQQHANVFSATTTPLYLNNIYKTLSSDPYLKNITVRCPVKAPLNCLMGIKAPAIAFEAGLKQSQDWRYYVKPIVQAIDALIKNLPGQQS
ncbi:hypothetical protein HOM50_05035 [bacterium]|mgnify:CR=1 FL=1|jgi:hypothetical protein|nr:hypothetical protein [bacterium]MBT5015746.1 hypothetical protein [bacterium]